MVVRISSAKQDSEIKKGRCVAVRTLRACSCTNIAAKAVSHKKISRSRGCFPQQPSHRSNNPYYSGFILMELIMHHVCTMRQRTRSTRRATVRCDGASLRRRGVYNTYTRNVYLALLRVTRVFNYESLKRRLLRAPSFPCAFMRLRTQEHCSVLSRRVSMPAASLPVRRMSFQYSFKRKWLWSLFETQKSERCSRILKILTVTF